MGVTFNDTEINDLDGVRIRNVTPARPSYTRHKVQIPGKPGSYDFGNSQPQDFAITVSVIVVANDRFQLRARINSLFDALEGKGDLITDGISVQAKVYEPVIMEENITGNVARGDIVFECDATEVEEND